MFKRQYLPKFGFKLKNLSNFQSFKFVGRRSETQI